MTIYMYTVPRSLIGSFSCFKIDRQYSAINAVYFLKKLRKLHAYLYKSFYRCHVLFFRVQCDIIVYCRIGEDL